MNHKSLLLALLICLAFVTDARASEDVVPTSHTAPIDNAVARAQSVETVEHLHEALIESMKNADELGYQGRFDFLRPQLEACFDLQFMASKAIGRHWKNLDEPNRELWVNRFQSLMAANYASRFINYAGQSFDTLGEEEAGHDTLLVRTHLVQPEDENVELNYRLRKTEQGWRIIDIYLNGTVSELALRRSEYSSLIRNDGFDQLMVSVDAKLVELADVDN